MQAETTRSCSNVSDRVCRRARKDLDGCRFPMVRSGVGTEFMNGALEHVGEVAQSSRCVCDLSPGCADQARNLAERLGGGVDRKAVRHGARARDAGGTRTGFRATWP